MTRATANKRYVVCRSCWGWQWESKLRYNPHCQCGRRFPEPKTNGGGDRSGDQGQQQDSQPPRKEQPKNKVGGKVLAALNKNWASLNDDVREKLQKVGFRAPEPEPEDPLQQALEACKNQLPKEVLEAYQATHKIQEPTQKELGVQATKTLSQATLRFRTLATKQIEAQVRIDELKEQLRVELEAMQNLTTQLQAVKEEVDLAKTKVSEVVIGPDKDKDKAKTDEEMEAAPDPEAFKTLLQKMGVALTDDQFTKFQELVEQSKAELVHKKRKTEVEAPPGLTSQTGKEERSRSRTPPK